MLNNSTENRCTPSDEKALAAKLDRCVMCGMCSQHCPTYQLTADENESPRGRISLISALISGRLNASARLQAHLEHCTGCRSCEAYCPSEVRFGSIITDAKALLVQSNSPQPFSVTPIASHSLRLYQKSGLQKLVRASGILNPLGLAQKENLLPAIPPTPAWKSDYPATTDTPQGSVALFTGCVANVFDRAALNASRRLLNAMGYNVHVPPDQGCCGAIALHNGHPKEAARLASQNLRAFSDLDVQAIVHTTSGCTAQLSEYSQLLADEQASAFTAKVKDISHFILEAHWPAGLQPAPLPKTVALHSPCSLRNILRQEDAPHRLLGRIPELKVIALPEAIRCCGGAGQYMLDQPTFSEQLREETLNSLDSINPQQEIDTLITSNLGCSLHLAAGLRARKQTVTIKHPVELLAQQLNLL